MRKNYPLISAELNDKFQDLYYKLTFILGYSDDDDDSTRSYTGQFDKIEDRLFDAVGTITYQTENENLIINKGFTPILEYKTWGESIIINELRGM